MKVAAVKKPGGPGNLIIEDRADPKPAVGEILVRIHASSLNYHDFVVVMGGIPTDDGRIPMSDGAGEVVAVGEGVTKFKPGDKVVSLFFPNWQAGEIEAAGFASVPGDGADGFGAELVAAPETSFTRMPEGYSYQEAATLPCAALTAWRALMVEAKVKPGDWVLTQGTGGVSIFALQFAKAAGCRVISTSSSDEKLQRVKELGADHVINYKDTPDWGKAAKALTGGRGVDEVVEIGGPGTLAQSITASRPGGHISLIGVLTGVSGEVPTAALFSLNITLSGITVGSRRHQEDMIAAIEANGIKPVLDKDFPLSEIAAAFAHQASQQHFGKITLSL
ncbi:MULTISPECIES: NAD(P)-dependent alcohol dehydrogenase [unclassified Hyphomonas]|jgi:NADPH:quinone reductase-like Zn-dependent oxidoreductase|uniref:zinc-dependent alcohol dehydrogenase family protein n=1 Tax=unclassified Hyphomonas TaxID=2630699 RepID=UPI000C67878D|nr:MULTISPECIES: NAD(P)-dependent alcohol dehydrogenase [unclassified Hyphomonas]MAN90820.1 NAD(P)-dependent alcohol dehydrogenase [Hyphomonadaceae bacterium]MAA81156.1 NAD(P)-dependent alcohol dehydrogenase [Hyphomonas sp.]MBO6584295.1 NAD(P)-dependent alcohol dehydrogenase [Hyphomonas sp.]RCL84507.1 MAG: NAD(P)-dependent alcohol dehydrogenase [Hyphomonas sp.]HCN92207.1 NAD(P)-dependent alcohol dehydrogenase [Hyphomonas sp.]|tara:strand:- start:3020 stop:4024 length:1005 start_codon:yes stop_codon:yes gene_type:complete